MFDRWNFTVCSVTQSIFASSEFEWPSAVRRRISVSRFVNSFAFVVRPRRMGRARLRIREVDRGRQQLPDRGGQIVGLRQFRAVRPRTRSKHCVTLALVALLGKHDAAGLSGS